MNKLKPKDWTDLALYSEVSVMSHYLENGYDVNTQNSEGMTSLMLAITRGSRERVIDL